ncbi:hypothetical protein [Fibrobacter sp. UWB10]|uniref:hypothetical protein n=1 Tax=Fibrobacter sp. UWB10 TaxID=1896201 RepID=UPI0024034FA2|nr:hypothetical protein [Fibrobacter sp. UWB10]SMP55918.1 hypothetical protein SAMN05720465_2531 [Fibrobacter sp. UWB10]
MIWVLGVLCALALVALFFPFIFWVDFSADFCEIIVRVRFFKKVVYTYEKKFGKKEPLDDEDSALSDDEGGSVAVNEEVAKAPEKPVESKAAPKVEQESKPEKPAEPESKPEPEKKIEPEPEKKPAEKKDEPKPVEKKSEPKPVEKSKSDDEPKQKEKTSEEKTSDDEKEEKRSLTDQEFWTLLLTPEFDTRAWWAVRHALSALFKLFRIRFVNCFVEGIRLQEYENMGYGAALNGIFKSYPYIGAWDFRMDWTRDHELHAEGHMRASINVCRVLGLIITTLFYGGIVAFTFWRRRAKILKTGELPELGFVRNKIVKMMSEDD